MACIRFCLLTAVALVLGSTSGKQEPEPRVVIQERSNSKVELNACIYLISVELVPPQGRLREGVRFHLPNYVRAKLGDMLLLNAREATTDDITNGDAIHPGRAIERWRDVLRSRHSQWQRHTGSNAGSAQSAAWNSKTGKATIEAVANYRGGRKETRKIEVEVTEKRNTRTE